MAVEPVVKLLLEQRQDVPDKRPAPRHPLVIRAPTVVIGSIQASVGQALEQPPEDGFVPHVHPQGHLRLLAIAAERAFADEKTDDHASIKFRQWAHVSFGGGTARPRASAGCSATARSKLFHGKEKRETSGGG